MCTQEKAEDPCALVSHSLVFVVLQTKHCTLTVGTLHLHTYQKEKDAALRELATYKEREAMAAREINIMHSRLPRVMKQLEQVIPHITPEI